MDPDELAGPKRGATMEWSWLHAALLLAFAFVARTWPARLAASTPQLEGVPYLGGLLRVAREVRRFPDFLVETGARFGGATWAIRCPRLGLLDGCAIVVTRPEVLTHVLREVDVRHRAA